MMGSNSDEMAFLFINDPEEKDQFLKSHYHLATGPTGKWYLMLAETRITMYTDYPDAIRWALCTIAIAKAIGDRFLEAEALCVSGEALLKLREGNQAYETFLKAKEIGGSDADILTRADKGINAVKSLPKKRSLASENGPLGQLLDIIYDKIAAPRFVGMHPYLKQQSVLIYCLQKANSNTELKEWDKVVQYARVAQIIAGAMHDYNTSIRAGCLCGDALVQLGDLPDAASAYLGVTIDSFELKEGLLPDVKELVSHAQESYAKFNSSHS